MPGPVLALINDCHNMGQHNDGSSESQVAAQHSSTLTQRAFCFSFFFFPYRRTFGTKCARCSRTISATDWVRRARDLIFHLACFACDSCGRQLSTGEQFALVDDKVLCKTHYSEMFDCGTSSDGKSGRRSPGGPPINTRSLDC